ncbi:uncharacterized protein LOC109857028 [Pseudomyrmex gracilis]|uniref:uncharacterized protein LOC109857028 n=1 Tax=Pseudomyrmex gracilis TaxID=219809 RepID=UPI00099548BD|nr:uncharacterized protein LOC109857028 [Pseudomyrmex gracilis]
MKSTMCTCEPTNATEEYYTAYSDIETSTPEEWRTSTMDYDEREFAPPAFSTPKRTPRRDIPRPSPRAPLRTRRQDLVAGVAIVRRRIDFDASLDVETDDLEEEDPREILERLKAAAPPAPAERLRFSRPRQHPEARYASQYAPRMTKVTPCGKCIRI